MIAKRSKQSSKYNCVGGANKVQGAIYSGHSASVVEALRIGIHKAVCQVVHGLANSSCRGSMIGCLLRKKVW